MFGNCYINNNIVCVCVCMSQLLLAVPVSPSYGVSSISYCSDRVQFRAYFPPITDSVW